MSDIGVEVGQKMRSAIKAKLTELDCYVDDELPDYIMVMIANKRTRSQMKDDLQLFLSTKTATFVEWLHIVLKKLKEVHVTNPEVFKKPVKRKPNELVISEDDFKKIKKEKKEEHKALKKARKEAKASKELQKSLTDDLPITANKLSEARKIVVMNENNLRQQNLNQGNSASADEDGFDIPLLSEISSSNEEELELLEKKIKNVKSRLGLHVESDEEEDCLNIKADPDDLSINEQLKKTKEPAPQQQQQNSERKIVVEQQKPLNSNDNNNTAAEEPPPKKSVHTRITFDKERDSLKAKYDAILKRNVSEEIKSPKKKRSVLERLGKRTSDDNRKNSVVEKKSIVEKKPEKILQGRVGKGEKIREGILSRLGVMSKVSIPPKRPKTPEIEVNEEEELKMAAKEVPSVVKLKPRMLPPKTKQANPNLLFKAVAEAQRSVSQTPAVGASEGPALFTKKYKEKMEMERNSDKDKEKEKEKEKEIPLRKAKLLEEDKLKLKVLLTENNEIEEEESTENQTINHKFIVTLDGIEKTKFSNSAKEEVKKSIVKTRRTPSPIIFDSQKSEKVPEKLPAVSAPALKNKERCKYWPGCRQGEKCEFFHPTAPCKLFPNCKYEDKCLYVHPVCKFETSCTRRDCPYSHTGKNAPRVSQPTAAPSQKPTSQICKYFPNCSNAHCTFYHPRLCKFGVFCKNQSECNFVHSFPTKPGNLTWRSDHK